MDQQCPLWGLGPGRAQEARKGPGTGCNSMKDLVVTRFVDFNLKHGLAQDAVKMKLSAGLSVSHYLLNFSSHECEHV